MNDAQQSPLQFPCDFPIKVMGHAQENFDALVATLVSQHVGDLREGAVKTRQSKNGRYLAVTVTIYATSREQLDAIYQDLCAHEAILMAL